MRIAARWSSHEHGVSRDLAATFKTRSEHGVEVLDVTISGSTPAAENGVANPVRRGDKQRFNAAESIFRVIAKKYFYLGPSGSGATMKLVVNTLLGIGMQAIAEAVALVKRLVLIAIVCWMCCPRQR